MAVPLLSGIFSGFESIFRNEGQYSAVYEQETPSDVIKGHREEVRYSVQQFAPAALAAMHEDAPGRDKQVFGAATRANVFGAHLELGFNPNEVEGDAHLFEQVLEGNASTTENLLSSPDPTDAEIIYAADMLQQELQQDTSEEDNISAIRARIENAAEKTPVDPSRFGNPDAVEVAHAAAVSVGIDGKQFAVAA